MIDPAQPQPTNDSSPDVVPTDADNETTPAGQNHTGRDSTAPDSTAPDSTAPGPQVEGANGSGASSSRSGGASWLRTLALAAPAAVLWSVGGAFPILSTVAGSPEYLGAHRLDGLRSFLFIAFVCLGVPVASLVLAALTRLRGVGEAFRFALVAVTGLCGGFAGLALHKFDGQWWWLQIALAALGAGFGAWWAYRPATTPSARYLGVLPVVLLGWFVLGTSSGQFIRAGSGDFPTARSVGNPAPVVFLTFDEFPVDVLLTSQLEINAERFPNFARLAKMSHWYPLASSVGGDTVSSVPGLVSGKRAVAGKIPVSELYPTDVLRTLSSEYDIVSREAFTRMCNASFCRVDGKAPDDPLASLKLLWSDTQIVWKHAVTPTRWEDRLPRIDGRFVNFAAEANALVASKWAAPTEHEAVADLVSTTNHSDRPLMWFGHFILPHFPYKLAPSGANYTVWRFGKHDSDTRAGEIGRVSERQRLVYQTIAVDRALGKALDVLERRGELKETAIVVTADHGRNFWKGLNRYPPPDERIDQITSVPLFIKEPGQVTGEVSWDHASTMDIVPTLLAMLDAKVEAEYDGVDLLSGPVPEVRTDSFLNTVLIKNKKTFPGYLTPRQSKETLRGLVDRMSTLLTPDGGIRSIVSIGSSGKWVGTSVDKIERSDKPAPRFANLASLHAPVMQVKVTASNMPSEIVAARNGTVVGVGLMGAERKGNTDVAAIVTEESLEADGDVTLWAVYPDGIVQMAQTR